MSLFLFQNLCTKKLKPKFDFDADVDVVNSVREGAYTLRRHPGTLNVKPVTLPEPLMQAVEVVLKGAVNGRKILT